MLTRSRFAACLTVLILVGASQGENWPQWRGPRSDGTSTETGLPTKWSSSENLAWTVPLPGMGGATPAIWGDRIFLTTEDGKDLVALCLGTDGKPRWKAVVGKTTNKARTDEGNGASPSPCTDGTHVWFFVGSGDLVCFTVEGTEVWKVNLQQRYGRFNIQFGMHSTPVLHKGRLYLQLLHTDKNHVVALDAAKGTEIWNVERLSDGREECLHSYASPVLWTNGTSEYLISHGNDYTVAHDLENGAEIWRLGGLNPKERYNPTLRFVASPLATPNLIIVPTAKRGPVVAVKPEAKGKIGPGDSSESWRMPRNTPDVPSPLLVNGYVYLCGESGTLYCLDAKTGEEKYAQPLFGKKSVRHRASPVYADGHIYVTSRDEGTVHVVKAGPKFELVAANKMGDIFSASPAISGGRIYLRGYKALYAVGK